MKDETTGAEKAQENGGAEFQVHRDGHSIWVSVSLQKARATLWDCGTASIKLFGLGWDVDVWVNSGIFDGDPVLQAIDRAVKVAGALGLEAPSAEEWAAFFGQAKMTLDAVGGEQ